MQAMKSSKDSFQAWLIEVVDSRFDGNAAKLSRLLGKAPGYLSDILNGKKDASEDYKAFVREKLAEIPAGDSLKEDATPYRVVTTPTFVEYVSADVKIRVPVLADPALNEVAMRNAERLINAKPAPLISSTPAVVAAVASMDDAEALAAQESGQKPGVGEPNGHTPAPKPAVDPKTSPPPAPQGPAPTAPAQ